MAEFKAQVFICTNSEGAEDQRHCGDKAGPAVFKAFRELRQKLGKEREILVTRVGCTSQHSQVGADQTTVIIYGPDPSTGGVWYKATTADVEELFQEHAIKGRVVERLVNPAMCVKCEPR